VCPSFAAGSQRTQLLEDDPKANHRSPELFGLRRLDLDRARFDAGYEQPATWSRYDKESFADQGKGGLIEAPMLQK
jgi:hypothetical protein